MARLVTSCVAGYMAPLKFSICVVLTFSGEAVNRKNSTALVISRCCIGMESAIEHAVM
ncbi:MAG: hypothetical protein JWL61_4811 [Gemmatimonadetes bacterium]|nr:hypothetical protein [Gemmatimonadota bacterium]